MKQIAFVLVGVSSLIWSGFNLQGGNSDIVRDNDTKLEWQNNSEVVKKELDWDNAVAYCKNLKLDGKGWRLPTKEELISIMDRDEDVHLVRKNNSKYAIKSIFLNRKIPNSNYWTSTLDKYDSNLRWGVNFQKGWTGRYSKHFPLKVRCVRGKLKDDKIPMAKLFGVVGKESKPFSEEKEGIIVILGEANPTMVKNK